MKVLVDKKMAKGVSPSHLASTPSVYLVFKSRVIYISCKHDGDLLKRLPRYGIWVKVGAKEKNYIHKPIALPQSSIKKMVIATFLFEDDFS